jgi:hypothetical protein
MNQLIDYGYYRGGGSDPPHASDYFDRYLESIQSSYSSLGSAGSQSEGSSFAASSAPTWLTDFIHHSDDSNFQPDSMPDVVVPNDTSFYPWPYQTELDEADYTEAFGSNAPNFQWDPTEPALNLSTSNHSESEPSEDSEQPSPGHSMPAQNDAASKLPVPRMRYFKCLTCPSQYSSKFRLRYILLIYYYLSLLTYPVNTFENPMRLHNSPVALATEDSSRRRI